ncbi:MAG: antitoxin Xre-like helix-turn-helix domain-containing protein [Ginsengibacter sp.]
MKSKKIYKKSGAQSSKAAEPLAAYGYVKQFNITKEFAYNDFKKIASKTDFTQKEWSDILHISERTLQRYSKENSLFSFSVSDRIIQIDKVLRRGQEVFGSYEKFLLWIHDNPNMLEGRLSLQSLASFEGINNVLTQLGRIEQGILA